MKIDIPYGKKTLRMDIEDKYEVEIADMTAIPSVVDESSEIYRALQSPISSMGLDEMVHPGQRIAIVVDDITRPTPTHKLLIPILYILAERGVPDKDIKIIFANGGHRPQTKEEMQMLLGKEVVDRFEVINHDARDNSQLDQLGHTVRGTPIAINRNVVRADLRILTGMIKPHNQAGYSGGGKAILPGVAGIDTIMRNHSYRYVSDPFSHLGVIKGNPIREDIEEVAGRLGPSFMVNAILKPDKSLAGVVAGDLIAAHRKGVEFLDSFSRVTVRRKADVVVAGCAYPAGIDFYQTLNAITASVRLEVPVIKAGGTIIVASECPEGVGHRAFFDLVRHFEKPEDFLQELATSTSFRDEQYAAQIWAEALCRARVIVVTQGISADDLGQLHAQHASSLEAALRLVPQSMEGKTRLLVMPNAPYTICSLDNAQSIE